MDVSSSSVATARVSIIVYDTLLSSLDTGARVSIELVLYCLCNLSSIYMKHYFAAQQEDMDDPILNKTRYL